MSPPEDRGSAPAGAASTRRRALLEAVAWMAAGLLLNMGIREGWLRAGLDLPSWGGLFLDMTGVVVVALGRGRGPAYGVVILDQIYRMAFGQVSNAFMPVEIAGATYWGWMWGTRRACFDWRRPGSLLKTFLLAWLGGGAACGAAAWLVNLVLRGEWDFMPAQQGLYASRTAVGYLAALPGEIALSAWDKGVTCLLAFALLVPLFALTELSPLAPGRRFAFLRTHSARLGLVYLLLITWGALLLVRSFHSLITPPVAIDFVVFRQALIIIASYLFLCATLLWFSFRRKAAGYPRHFLPAWSSVALGIALVFFSGLYFVANSIVGNVYRTRWDVQRDFAVRVQSDPTFVIPGVMGRIDLGPQWAGMPEGFRFVSREAARREVLWGDLTDEMGHLFPEDDSGRIAPVEGFLDTPEGLQVATYTPWKDRRGGFLLYLEAPWIFHHDHADQLAPSLAALGVLGLLTALLFWLLARYQARVGTAALLGRQAKRLASQIRLRNEELERVQAELEAAAARRDQQIRELSSLAEIGKAVGILAHEIRNPIGTVQMAFGNLLDSLGTDPEGDLQEQVAIIERQIRYMNMLTQSVLAFSRSAAGTGEDLVRRPVVQLLETCRSLSGPLAARHGVELTLVAPPPELAVSVRENEALLILQNLVNNAVEALVAMPPGAPRRIVLAARRANGDAVLSVTDTGPGISEGDQEKLWDLFFTRKTTGLGLGLPMARELARFLQGDLRVTSEVGHGTTFELVLPAAP